MNPLIEKHRAGERVTLEDKAETMDSEAEVRGWLAEAKRNGDAAALEAGRRRMKAIGGQL